MKKGFSRQSKLGPSESSSLSRAIWSAPRATWKAKERLAKIKEVSKGATGDLANEYMFEDRVIAAELEARKAEFAVELAASKLKVLTNYTKPKTVKELKSEVERARSNELSKKAIWEIELVKSNRAQRIASKKDLPAAEKRMLGLLARGVSIDDSIRAKLEQHTKNGKPDDASAKIIEDLTNQLELIVERAEEERAAAQLDRLKRSIGDAAREYSADAP